jgi:hypothetical protein
MITAGSWDEVMFITSRVLERVATDTALLLAERCDALGRQFERADDIETWLGLRP